MHVKAGNSKPQDRPEIYSNEEKAENEYEDSLPDEILKSIPEEERGEFIRSVTQISGVFPHHNPIIKKITPEHIAAIINNSDEQDKRDRQERKDERRHNFIILVTTIVALLLISGLFIYAQQLDFLKYIIGAILGFAGGFGVGKNFKQSE